MARKIESGTFLSRAIEMLGDDFPVILGLSLLVWSPRLVLAVVAPGLGFGGGAAGPEGPVGGAAADVGTGTFFGFLLTLAAAVLLTQIQTAVLTWRIVLREESEAGGGRLWSVLPAAFGTAVVVAVLTAFGFGFFLIPGWVVMSAFFVALPAQVLQRLSVSEALRTSVRLTDGHKLPLFILVLMLTVVERLLGIGIQWAGLPALLATLGAVLVATLQALLAIAAYQELSRLAAGEPARPEPQPPPRKPRGAKAAVPPSAVVAKPEHDEPSAGPTTEDEER
ncbi:MAG: hypothetical protein SX243_02565 [Acidobacteriota bacterium]|nr:hypothetical protein [Acidobacteriota bacterium]